MNTTPEKSGPRGLVPSRRVLLRAGGLLILTGSGVAAPACAAWPPSGSSSRCTTFTTGGSGSR